MRVRRRACGADAVWVVVQVLLSPCEGLARDLGLSVLVSECVFDLGAADWRGGGGVVVVGWVEVEVGVVVGGGRRVGGGAVPSFARFAWW